MKKRCLNRTSIVEFSLLLLLYFQMIYLIISDKLKLLINPEYNSFVFISLVVLLCFMIFLFRNIFIRVEKSKFPFDSKYVLLLVVILLMVVPSYSDYQKRITELKGAKIDNTTIYQGESNEEYSLDEDDSMALDGNETKTGNIDIVVNDKNFIPTLDEIFKKPKKYNGKSITIEGFVYRSNKIDEKYFIISRMSMICCAADSSIVGIFCEIEDSTYEFKQNDWFKIEGVINLKKLRIKADKRKMPVISIKKFKKIKKHKSPYVYPVFTK